MAKIRITYRPLTAWPAQRTRRTHHKPSAFKAYHDDTMLLLDTELAHIRATDVVLQVDVVQEDRDFRSDGAVRVDARVRSPAVVLTFKRNGASLLFATDVFSRWPDNVRAIALGLGDLRRIERYEIAQTGDQYRGWHALPASTTTALSTEGAADVLARRTGRSPVAILADRVVARDAYREAASAAHPDRGGATADFQLIHEAKRVLEAHFGGPL